MVLKRKIILVDWELWRLDGSVLVYRIIFDWISLRFLGVVFLISSGVIYYRDEYIRHEKSKNSFCFIVFLFVISIIFLIISPNLIRVILGWDGLGLVSYLLVVYYQNFKSYAAGIITCLTNRIGDRAILISIGWILSTGSLEFRFYLTEVNREMLVCRIFIVLAAITKRAQIPFSAWLPAAIAAPTPVSALVHSSTLVTAGVYLLIRFYPLFMLREIKNILFLCGRLTIIISRLGALYEIDLKKIIALSTLRQLGLIIVSLRIGLYILAFFHLLTHALFKACLFICAGRMIHLFNGSQDIRNLNMVRSCIPITSSCLTICRLALGGTPFLAAFYSKDKIIEEAFSRGYNFFCLTLLFFSVILTMIYSFRLIFYIRMESYDIVYENNQDRKNIIKPILLLRVGGITGGSFLSWVILDLEYRNLFIELKLGILGLFSLGYFLGNNINFNRINIKRFFMGTMWFLPIISRKLVLLLGFNYRKRVEKYWDYGWNEALGPRGLSSEIRVMGSLRSRWTQLRFKSLMFLSFTFLILIIIYIYLYSLYKA